MRRGVVCPTVWLFTDPRQGEALWAALERLPRGAGVIFRHAGVPGRAALGARVRVVARRRGLAFVVADDARLARALGADGSHRHAAGRAGDWPPGLRTAVSHSGSELRAAERGGADLVFLSPLYATRSHPGARPLGRVRFALLARTATGKVGALGGMNAARFKALRPLGARAWGAIDAFLRPIQHP